MLGFCLLQRRKNIVTLSAGFTQTLHKELVTPLWVSEHVRHTAAFGAKENDEIHESKSSVDRLLAEPNTFESHHH
jgi:hypothetical protein